MKNLLVFALFIMFLSSCKTYKKQQLIDRSTSCLSVTPKECLKQTTTNNKFTTTKTSSSTILDATNASQIPMQMFAVNPIYKTAYFHLKQPNLASSSWTSYVNCINCIVTANNSYCYPTAISTVRYRCQNYYPQVTENSANHILALEWYAYTYDKGFVCYSRKSPTSRWSASKEMLAHIKTYHSPFVVCSSMNNTSHYRIIFSIDWKQSESISTVYYTDCAYSHEKAGSFNANIQSMSLSNFLDSMTIDANAYNMLFMWPK